MIRTPDQVRLACAMRFAAAMEATGTSTAALAVALGVSERIIYDLRTGSRPLTGERLDLCPPKLSAEYYRRALSDCEGERAHPLTPEGQAQVVMAEAADVLAVTLRALPNGIDPGEAQEILAELRPMLRTGRELEQQLEGVAHGGGSLRAVGGGR